MYCQQEYTQTSLPLELIDIISSFNNKAFQFVSRKFYLSNLNEQKNQFIKASKYNNFNNSMEKEVAPGRELDAENLLDICINTPVKHLEIYISRCDRNGCDIQLQMGDIYLSFHKKRATYLNLSYCNTQADCSTNLSINKLETLLSHREFISMLGCKLPFGIKRVIFGYILSGYSNKWVDVKAMVFALVKEAVHYSGDCHIKVRINAFKTRSDREPNPYKQYSADELATNESYTFDL